MYILSHCRLVLVFLGAWAVAPSLQSFGFTGTFKNMSPRYAMYFSDGKPQSVNKPYNHAIEADAFAAGLPLRCAAHRGRWA